MGADHTRFDDTRSDDGEDEQIALTGERTAPGIPEENYWFQRHVVAYRLAQQLVGDRRVLDAGCGEGYGSDILARSASEVVGVDLEADVVRRAQARYPRATFKAADLMSMPFEDASFGAVVSLQVIEHLHIPQGFLAECARVLEPGGILIIATPNRLTFSPTGIRNPFHTFEFAPAEMRTAIEKHFTDLQLKGTFHGPRIRAIELLIREGFAERLIRQPAYEWPAWVRMAVARVTPGDFTVGDRDLDRSLDLIAIARG